MFVWHVAHQSPQVACPGAVLTPYATRTCPTPFVVSFTLYVDGATATGTPVVFFYFFEALMRITLPKGMRFLDPVFNALSDLIY